MNYSKKIFWLIFIATIARSVIAKSTELNNDEAYYWTYALHLQWNYFDHPPIVGWLIRLTTVNLLLHNEFAVRFGAIASSAICTYLIYRAGSIVKDTQTGWYAAVLYTGSIYSSIIAGTFILPDSPQMVFWLWSVFLLLKILKLPPGENSKKLWLWFGVSAGLCIMCKVHGVFLWFAVALYSVFFERGWLRNKWLFLSAAISLLIVSPIIIWNIQNHFVSYAYHGNRVNFTGTGFNIEAFGKELAGEFFYNNPVNFFLTWATIAAVFKGKLASYKKESKLLFCCAFPLIAVVILISLFRDTLPHWSGPAYSTLLILTATRLTSATNNKKVIFNKKLLKTSIAFIAIIAVAGIVLINFYPGTLSPKKSEENMGEGDFTLDMYGWKQAGIKIDSLYKKDVAEHVMPATTRVIVFKWFPAAHIDFYIASPIQVETYGLGSLSDLHQYYWYNKDTKPLQKGASAYFIVPSNLFDAADITRLKKSFTYISSLSIIPVYRSGVICKEYYVFRLKGYGM